MACRWHTGRIMWEREVELGVGWSKGSESFVDAVCRCREWEECGWDVTWMTPGRKIQRRRWMYGGGKQKVVELKDTFSCQRAADDAESWGKWAKPNLRRDRQRTTDKTERDKERSYIKVRDMQPASFLLRADLLLLWLSWGTSTTCRTEEVPPDLHKIYIIVE